MEPCFSHPPLRVTVESLEAHFRSEGVRDLAPIRNPHHEPKMDAEARGRAVPASVLIPIVQRRSGLVVLFTRRHPDISSPGQLCFPGGRADDGDASPEATALREAHEEIGLEASSVRILGRLGDYVSQAGFRIAPVVGIVTPPLDLVLHPAEVEEVLEIPLERAFDARSYALHPRGPRAYFVLRHEEAWVTGATVSMMMGFYEDLLASHDPARGAPSSSR